MRSNRTLLLTVLLCAVTWLVAVNWFTGQSSPLAAPQFALRESRQSSSGYAGRPAGSGSATYGFAADGMAMLEHENRAPSSAPMPTPDAPDASLRWRKGESAGRFDVPTSDEADQNADRPAEEAIERAPAKPGPATRDERAESEPAAPRPPADPGASSGGDGEDFEAAKGDSSASSDIGGARFGNKDAERAGLKKAVDTKAREQKELQAAAERTSDAEATAAFEDSLAARQRLPRPTRFLPRSAYFENTYLGGNAAVLERQRRLDASWGGSTPCPYRLASLGPQAFDPPTNDGLGLHCSLDRSWQEKPGRVMLQIGLRGSDRYGWRRPPLDVMCVVDMSAMAAGRAVVNELIVSLVRQLGPQDKLGLAFAARPGAVLVPPRRLRDIRAELPEHLTKLQPDTASGAEELRAALAYSGHALTDTTGSGVPGTQTVLLVVGPADASRVAQGRAMAHSLSLMGIVTSVIEVGNAANSEWWDVAHHGQGNHHRLTGAAVGDVVAAEIGSLARVVARLARINIRLGADTHAVRILGSRVLDQTEVRRVKDREEATDRQLSRALGVASDRGEDDDGLQTVIPYFYGGDAHVVLVELYVDRPGTVAEISVRYKDMVRLTNAQVHATVSLAHAPRQATRLQAEVTRNAARFGVALRLGRAAEALNNGNLGLAYELLQRAAADTPAGSNERRMIDELAQRARNEGRTARVLDAIDLAAERLVGQSPVKAGQ